MCVFVCGCICTYVHLSDVFGAFHDKCICLPAQNKRNRREKKIDKKNQSATDESSVLPYCAVRLHCDVNGIHECMWRMWTRCSHALPRDISCRYSWMRFGSTGHSANMFTHLSWYKSSVIMNYKGFALFFSCMTSIKYPNTSWSSYLLMTK